MLKIRNKKGRAVTLTGLRGRGIYLGPYATVPIDARELQSDGLQKAIKNGVIESLSSKKIEAKKPVIVPTHVYMPTETGPKTIKTDQIKVQPETPIEPQIKKPQKRRSYKRKLIKS